MKLTYRLLALVALMLVVNVTVHAQQKGESRVDKFVRKHEGSHEEHDRTCHEAIQAAISKKHNINPYSHHYVNDIMQLQPLRHEVEDKCAPCSSMSRQKIGMNLSVLWRLRSPARFCPPAFSVPAGIAVPPFGAVG